LKFEKKFLIAGMRVFFQGKQGGDHLLEGASVKGWPTQSGRKEFLKED